MTNSVVIDYNGSEVDQRIENLPGIDEYSIKSYEESSDGTTSLSDSSEVSSSSSIAAFFEPVKKIFHKKNKSTDNDTDDDDTGSSFSMFRHHRRRKGRRLSGSDPTADSQFAQGTDLQDDEFHSKSDEGSSSDELFEKNVGNDVNTESPLTPMECSDKNMSGSIDFAKFFYDTWSLLTRDEITLEALGNKRPDEYLLTCLVTLQKEYETIRNQNVEYEDEVLQLNTEMQSLKNSSQRKIKKLKKSYEQAVELYNKKLEISEDAKRKEIEKGISDFSTINIDLESKNRELEEMNKELEVKNEVLDEKVTNLTKLLSTTSRRLIDSDQKVERYEETLQSSKEKFYEVQTEIKRSYQAMEQLKNKYEYQHSKLLGHKKETLFYRRLTEFFEVCMRESLSFMGYLLEAFRDKFKEDELNELNNYFVQMNKITELRRDLLITTEMESKFQDAQELLYNFYTVEAKTKFVEPLLMRLETAERSVTFLTNQLGDSNKKIADMKTYIKRKKLMAQSSAEESYNHRTLTSVNHTEMLNR